MRGLLTPFRITNGRRFRLDDARSARHRRHPLQRARPPTGWRRGLESLRDLQEKLYAQGTWALLLIFQAMDAAGKDSTIKHVMSGLNPQGCQVSSFKAPSAEELAHDFLWRTTVRLPERGHIGVFNRSYYEEVLVVRVHPEILGSQRLPPAVMSKTDLDGALRGHRRLRAALAAQRRRGAEILPATSRRRNRSGASSSGSTRRPRTGSSRPATCASAARWGDYMAAYEDMIRHTATPRRRGSSFPRITSGSPAWSSPRRSSTR